MSSFRFGAGPYLAAAVSISADIVFQARGFAFIKELDVDAERRETARKACIGVHLFEHCFDFVDGETIVQSLGKCFLELFLIAVGGKGCNRNDARFAGGEFCGG